LPELKDTTKKISKPEKKITPKGSTRTISLDMFNEGKSVAEIAEERGLVQSTIESHLIFFVEEGTLSINKLLSSEQQKTIAGELSAGEEENTLGSVKERLGKEYAYSQIRMMIAHQNYLASKE
jgi:uncharacterized protein YpbB